MREGKPKYFQKVTVIFGPDEENKFLDEYRDWRCLGMAPRTDLKPWGTREAVMERQIKAPKR